MRDRNKTGEPNDCSRFQMAREKVECIKQRHEDFLKSQNEILEIKTSTSEMINTLDGIKGRLNVAEEKISELEDKAMETMQKEIPKKKTLKITFKKEKKEESNSEI